MDGAAISWNEEKETLNGYNKKNMYLVEKDIRVK